MTVNVKGCVVCVVVCVVCAGLCVGERLSG